MDNLIILVPKTYNFKMSYLINIVPEIYNSTVLVPKNATTTPFPILDFANLGDYQNILFDRWQKGIKIFMLPSHTSLQ